jgi:hypothetical protein
MQLELWVVDIWHLRTAVLAALAIEQSESEMTQHGGDLKQGRVFQRLRRTCRDF